MRPLLPVLAVALLLVTCSAADTPALAESASAREPVVYTGGLQTDKHFTDGRLPHAIGAHHYQVFRANRTHPPEGGIAGWTYNHQPYLAHWNGRFYLQYLSTLSQEHEPPTRTLLMTSEDGRTWSAPTVVFPEYQLPAIDRDGIHIPAGMGAVMHQRMGFYVAPNGRLLTLGFYGFAATPRHSPNAGNGLGRVVREVKADGTFGPVYFIRYNRHAGFNETNTSFPFYRTSDDTGFLAACEALLQDKLMTLQWWEEDRGKDGFYTINPEEVAGAATFNAKMVTSAGAGKAFNWYTRPDGIVVGLWKNQYSALSGDRGRTWTPVVTSQSLRGDAGAKTWGQRTDDGRYAIVQDLSAAKTNRFPMVVMTGADGHVFDSLYCLQGDVPVRRYQGQYKSAGPAYFRGITEGNGNPPGDHLWVTYSMNKEDIWIARVTVPVTGQETAPLREDFEKAATVADLGRWNLHLPQWAPVAPVAEPGTANRVLELRDEEPYDYAKAERVFPAARKVTVKFRVQARAVAQGTALDIEVQSQRGDRPMRLRLDRHWLGFDRATHRPEPVAVSPGRWYGVELAFDCERQTYAVSVDGRLVHEALPFAEKTGSLERIVFRTGPFRGWVAPNIVDQGEDKPSGLDTEDQPGADERTTPSVYWIDDLETR